MGSVFALAAAFSWAIANLLYRRSVVSESLLRANFIRLLAPLVASGCALLILGRASFLTGIDAVTLLLVTGGTIVSLILGDSLFFYSLRMIGVQITSVITASYPLFSLVIGLVCLNESVSLLDVVGILLVASGIAVLTGRPSPTRDSQVSMDKESVPTRFPLGAFSARLCGVLAALLAAALWAVGIALFDVALGGISSTAITFLRCAIAMCFLAPVLGIRKEMPHLGVKNLKRWWPLMLAGLLSQGLAQFLLYVALTKGHSVIAVPLSSTAPLFVILICAAFRIEKVTLQTATGGLLTTIGVIALLL